MTYSLIETSRQGGRPVYLYLIVQGAQEWALTTSARPMTFGGAVYQPSPISHSEPKQTNELSKDGVALTLPVGDDLASQFLGYSPDQVTSVTIFRLHYDDPDAEAIVFWKGRVASSKASGGKATIQCESIFTSLRRPGLRARYQRTCRHALYGKGCGANPEAFALIATPSALSASGVVVTVPEAASYPSGYFFGGMLRASDASLRLIVGHSGQEITISRPIRQLSQDFVDAGVLGAGYGANYGGLYGGLGVTIYPGCDRSTTVCAGRFGNLDNYGGFPFIPTKNPFGGSSIV